MNNVGCLKMEKEKKAYVKPVAELINFMLSETIADITEGEWTTSDVPDFVDP